MCGWVTQNPGAGRHLPARAWGCGQILTEVVQLPRVASICLRPSAGQLATLVTTPRKVRTEGRREPGCRHQALLRCLTLLWQKNCGRKKTLVLLLSKIHPRSLLQITASPHRRSHPSQA